MVNSSGVTPLKKRPLKRLDLVILAGIAAFLVWLLVPGLGLDLLNLEGEHASSQASGQNDELLAQLDALPLLSDAKVPTYQRAQFGDGWADLDGDDCSTRNEILARDLAEVTFRPRTNNCVVQTGVLTCPFTGNVVEFERGEGTSDLIQIDHVVPLANAWHSGAWDWDFQTRVEFSNDPANLLAVDGQTNQDKGSATADQWMPPNRDFWCEYAARQVLVKSHWKLAVSASEEDALRDVLDSCPTVKLDLYE